MKKIVNIFILSSFFMMSCSEDFLDLAPEDSITSGNFFKTEAHFNQALIGTYAKLRAAFNADHAWMFGEQRSDNTHITYNAANRPVFVVEKELSDQFLETSTFLDVEQKYVSLYSTISSANFIITRIAESGLEASVVDPIVGQAKFIRALCYFDLVRYYGGVQLFDQAVESADAAFVPRSSVAEVYDLILSDAEDAVNKLAVPTFPQDGQATKSSARMLLGHVHLTLKNYEEALDQFQAITTHGHTLLLSYASVFELANKNSSESIFELQYTKAPGQNQFNSALIKFLPITSDLSMILGFNPSANTLGGNNVPTQEMIDSYEPDDERLNASIGIAEGTGGIFESYVIESLHSPEGYTTPDGKVSYPYIKKFIHPHEIYAQSDDNFPVFRYAETLLSLAEVLNELNRSSEALPYLNQVRKRAGLSDVTETSQSALRDIIAHERRIELAFENKRWLDLVRTDRAIDVMNQNGEYIRTAFSFGIGLYLLDAGYKVNQEKLLLPIPEREIRVGSLDQNPGYF